MKTTNPEYSPEMLRKRLHSFITHGTADCPDNSRPMLHRMMVGTPEQKSIREAEFFRAKAVGLCVGILSQLPAEDRLAAVRKVAELIEQSDED
jgi:hypothetical protein